MMPTQQLTDFENRLLSLKSCLSLTKRTSRRGRSAHTAVIGRSRSRRRCRREGAR